MHLPGKLFVNVLSWTPRRTPDIHPLFQNISIAFPLTNPRGLGKGRWRRRTEMYSTKLQAFIVCKIFGIYVCYAHTHTDMLVHICRGSYKARNFTSNIRKSLNVAVGDGNGTLCGWDLNVASET